MCKMCCEKRMREKRVYVDSIWNWIIRAKIFHISTSSQSTESCSTQVDLNWQANVMHTHTCTLIHIRFVSAASLWRNHSGFHSSDWCVYVRAISTMNNTRTINAWIATIKECRMSDQCEWWRAREFVSNRQTPRYYIVYDIPKWWWRCVRHMLFSKENNQGAVNLGCKIHRFIGERYECQ